MRSPPVSRVRSRGRPWSPPVLSLLALLSFIPLQLEAQEPAPSAAPAVSEAVAARLRELYQRSGVPGVTVGVALPDGRAFGVAAGFADTTLHVRMTPSSRLLQGSVGKTYVAAVALQLVGEGRLDLTAKISEYLGAEPWFARLPNAAEVTVRQLMNHTSGIVRYEFDERFIADLLAAPDKRWEPVELLAYLFDTDAPFAAGDGWEYSDTNYILLGMIIERITGRAYYDELRDRILEPLGLENTVPSDSPRIPGLVQGYPGRDNPFRLPDAVIAGGRFVINPQFEWTGGGIASTAEDLARWGWLLYSGRVLEPALLSMMVDGVEARLGPGTQYGLGVILGTTPLGSSWGHSGFFPGYLTEMAYFPDHEIAVAVQVNSSDLGAFAIRPRQILLEMANSVLEWQ